MERLACSKAASFHPVEAAIHIARYAPALGACAGRRVLDIACGEGYGAFLMASAGAAEVVGVEIDAAALETARSQFPHPALRLLQGDAERVDELLGAARFDLIVSLETIEHLRDPLRFLAAIGRLRAEGGSVLLSCPNDHWYYTAEQSNPYHVRKYHFAEFRALTEQVLGPAGAWFIGTAALGFTGVPLQGLAPGRDGSDHARARPLPAGFLCPPGREDPVTAERGSYFFGAWGPEAERMLGAAVFPLSMDRYAELTATQQALHQARQQLEAERATWAGADAAFTARLRELEQGFHQATRQLEAERATWTAAEAAFTARLQELQQGVHQATQQLEAERAAWAAAEAGLTARRQELEQSLAEARAAGERELRQLRGMLEQERSLARVQVNALRQENDILAESIAAMRRREAAAAAAAQTREAELAAAAQAREAELVATAEAREAELTAAARAQEAEAAAAVRLREAELLAALHAREAEAARELAALREERDFLATERARMIERLRPVWWVAARTPRPVRLAARAAAGRLMRLAAPRG
ncbi:methyltransferase domain-containing protein [Siccirubricoccus phaeus]|uniref:methyltransferase domain-containing protein n=1 Tax=Siccirubricoccus phaeus TaxID=2595053 RepID=UPI0011F403E8|nr:methyltransferase domain-containing protein [Siccirubricoccus phaeus]